MGSAPDATGAQINYIFRLMDQRVVTQKVAARIIQMLEDCSMVGDTGMDLNWLKQQGDEQFNECPPDHFFEG